MSNKKTVLNSQVKYICIFSALAVVLAVAFVVFPKVFKQKEYTLVLPLYDSINGDVLEYDTFKSDDGTKVSVTKNEDGYTAVATGKITYNTRPFIYPEIPVDEIKEITIVNGNGTINMYLDETTEQHFLKGREYQPYNEQKFSDLRFQSRFMLASRRFDELYETDEQLKPFGLDTGSNPVKVTVSDVSGNTYNVYIGAPLVSGNGYYAKDDDPYVYVLDGSVSVLFCDVNEIINPMVLMPLTQNEYQYAEELTIYKDGEIFVSSSILSEEARKNTASSDLHKITYPGNYPASMNNYYIALECFAALNGTRVVESAVLASGNENADAVFEKYGLTVASNDVILKTAGKENRFITGNRFIDTDGSDCFYAYSPQFDTIVVLPVANVPFLDFELLDFINSSFFQVNITNVAEISFEVGNKSYVFVLSGTGKELTVTEKLSGKVVDTASFRQLYMSLLTAKIEGYAGAENVTGGRELKYKVKSIYGEETIYEFSLISTTRELLTLDGSSQFYTARSYVTDIINKLDMLMNDEIITPDY